MINDQETHRHVVTSYTDAPTGTIAAGGVDFAYRELGPKTGVPVICAGTRARWLIMSQDRGIRPVAARSSSRGLCSRGALDRQSPAAAAASTLSRRASSIRS